ncbi:M14 family metallopeptidase [Alteromonas sp. C1M14]|uniref:M14 family metallopeptidase n=1 Tax=Alteromonas sp. C1M14 TaxID=2841567 RepID=UPI001C08799A|nr:M14 family metallopeptidase [Alteromonas sp. C1M14]MBU2977193.1 peptidase M14 [Alteromonas sp. C1M14]
MHTFRHLACTLATLFLINFPAVGDEYSSPASDIKDAMWPGATYSPAIPSIESVLGYRIGERITTHSDMLRYFHALAEAAPEQVRVASYGKSWEGRELIYVAIGAKQYIGQLDTFAEQMNQLADPRVTSSAEAKKLIATLPSSVWLEHGVHGNELSSTDTAMMTAYHLLAAQDDPLVNTVLANTLVFIDPLQNPDGRTRFTNFYYGNLGLQDSADRLSVDQNEPWPRGRSNHYLFDMNRDWLAITQPETAGRIAILNHFKPTVVIDLHEMGGDASYFFVPSANPINPHMQQGQLENNTLIGKNNAKHFDRFGFDYFTREVFDAFYPGYGDSWPTFYGASAATYEVASTRGMVFRDKDGKVNHYREPVQKHFVASLATLEAAAVNREKILSDFYQYQINAINAGKKDEERTFIIPVQQDRAGSHHLAQLMAQHGVEVTQATESFKACGTRYDKGSYIIDTAQPRGLYVKTTFTQQVDMADDFIEEQERRRARKLNDQIYDVTAWSLPLLFNIDTAACSKQVKVDSITVTAETPLEGYVTNTDAQVAYLVPWGDSAAGRFLTGALKAGVKLKSVDAAITLESGEPFPAGTLVIETKANTPAIHQQVAALALESGAIVTGIDSSWVTQGPNFGSARTATMVAPNIAIAWDTPTRSLSAGSTRFILEQQFNYPVTAIRTSMLASRNLNHYQVIILPDGNYTRALGKQGAENLKRWVEQGGVLVTLANATAYAASPESGLLATQLEYQLNEEDAPPPPGGASDGWVQGSRIASKAEFIQRIEDHHRVPDYVAGILANVAVDQEHWLTAGVNPQVTALVTGNTIFSPITLSSGKNLAWYEEEKNLLASGYIWKENQRQLAYKPFLLYQPTGNGMVIGFTQDPTSRAFLNGLNVMLLNAIFRSSAHATPYR